MVMWRLITAVVLMGAQEQCYLGITGILTLVPSLWNEGGSEIKCFPFL